jgi:putative DNA primase/helicase
MHDVISGAASGVVVPSVPLSDDDLALTFTEAGRDRVRYVDEWQSWLFFDGARWAPMSLPKIWNIVRGFARDYALRCNGSATERRQMASAQKIAAAERLARGTPGIIIEAAVLDADPWLLNTPGGVMDLGTGKLRPPDPSAYCTKITAVTPGGDCPKWKQFLAEVTNGDADFQAYLQRLAGYALIGRVFEHVIAFLWGPGGNGKGTFIDTLRGAMGDYGATAPIGTFTESRTDRHPTELTIFRGARLVTADETAEGHAWDEAKIKQLTGGGLIRARFMHSNFFEFAPSHLLMMAGNHKPRLHNVDEAIRRRMHMVPFTAQFGSIDDELPFKLRAEWPGILQWMIEGCLEWQKYRLSPPAIVVDETAEYLSSQDALRDWTEECCILDPTAGAVRTALWDSYSGFSPRRMELGALKRDDFYERLDSRFRRGKIGPKSERGYRGIGLSPADSSTAATTA